MSFYYVNLSEVRRLLNEQNLKPIEHLSKEEAKRRGSLGGKASVASRRKKKSMKQVMDMLLDMPANPDFDYDTLAEQGIDVDTLEPEFVNNMLVVNAALLAKAKTGDNKAIHELRSIIQDDIYTKHKIKLEKEKLKLDKDKINPTKTDVNKYSGIPASLIAPTFSSVLFDISEHEHSEYTFPGGRGSTKSSFISLNVIDLIKKNENMHVCVLRAVANTLKDSVFAQILWAVSSLGLDDEFTYTKSPLEITCISTGQKIYFRGADDPNKIKSIKPPFGYIGVVWFEELDQFAGEESVRKIEQSVIRGGELAYKFKSFNPPKSAQNWANKYIKIPRADRLVIESTYLTVPQKWLGKPFLDDAEFLKEVNPVAYENEYMGVANGTGGNVFDNVIIKEVTDDEIQQFDRVYRGVDWGWYPDPYAYVACCYQPAQSRLIIFDEYRCNKCSNKQTAEELVKNHGVTANDMIICDSAEEKSTGDYRSYGLLARGAEKGPGSVDYSMKWLQSLREIVIDNKRCPETAREFLDYEYVRDKEGNVISGYPDKDNHSIDAVRYALNRVWKRRGQ